MSAALRSLTQFILDVRLSLSLACLVPVRCRADELLSSSSQKEDGKR